MLHIQCNYRTNRTKHEEKCEIEREREPPDNHSIHKVYPVITHNVSVQKKTAVGQIS